MTDQQRPGIIAAGIVVARDISIGTAVTAADFGAGAEPAGPRELRPDLAAAQARTEHPAPG